MEREVVLQAMRNAQEPWDMLVIGGGATGLGTAVDAATRGYRTLLVEQADFSQGTSSRSTKLVHGGVRYLKQGNISLVLEALRERGRLCTHAAHLCSQQGFIIPIYRWRDRPFYGMGLKLYDAMAGADSFPASQWLSKAATLQRIPTLEPNSLKGGILYYDGQFDDARLAINLAQTIFNYGSCAINYVKVTQLLQSNGRTCGVIAQDQETNEVFTIKAKVVINATGVFTDSIRQLDDPSAAPIIVPSQGTHIVLPLTFLRGDTALMIPKTSDGRVLFAVPWHGCAIIGTTDTERTTPSLEPLPLDEEIEFILNAIAHYLTSPPTRKDILSVFSGLRPLIKPAHTSRTAAISRDHTILVSTTGLVSITGGKWTTFRKMAQDTVDRAAVVAQLPPLPCRTDSLNIHGNGSAISLQFPTLSYYGQDAHEIEQLALATPVLQERLHPQLPYIGAEVVWAVRYEMARTVADVLARRTRALILNARASIAAAPNVAHLLATEFKHSATWEQQAVQAYTQLARGYLP